jgi:hypothetical protein
MTWEELVADVTARYPLKESKMFGMPCLKRESGKVLAGQWKDGGSPSSSPTQGSAKPHLRLAPGPSTREWAMS